MQRSVIFKSSLIVLAVAGLSFFWQKYFSIGLGIGLIAANINFLILQRQIALYISKRKFYLIIMSYFVRYAFLGAILYAAVRYNMLLFMGVLTGFFIVQAVFFWENISNPQQK